MADIVISGDSSGSVTLRAPAVSGTTVLTLPTTSGTIVTTAGATTLTTSGNLTFTGTGNRITGDFSNATLANRVMFQTSTANANTRIGMMPSSASTGTSGPVLYSTNDPNNSSIFDIRITDGGSASLQSFQSGTGANLPLTMFTGGSERLRIDTSGNVGIGTSSAQSSLDVGVGSASAPTFKGHIRLNGGGLAANGGLEFMNTTFASGYGWRLQTPDEGGGSTPIVFQARSNSASWTERMRIDSSGNLLVGTTSSGSIQKGFQVLDYANGYYGRIGHNSSAASGDSYMVFQYNAGTIGQISQNGTTGVTYATTSDYRLKENIAPMIGALNTVAQLKPVTYNWKADGSSGQGFIAHELQEVVPDCVTGEKDAVDAEGNPVYQGIDTSFLVATLTAAIQELNAKVTALEAQLGAK